MAGLTSCGGLGLGPADDKTIVPLPPTGARAEVLGLTRNERRIYGLLEDSDAPVIAVFQFGPGVPAAFRFVGSGRSVKVTNLTEGTIITVKELPR
jgi:hypothetical protein